MAVRTPCLRVTLTRFLRPAFLPEPWLPPMTLSPSLDLTPLPRPSLPSWAQRPWALRPSLGPTSLPGPQVPPRALPLPGPTLPGPDLQPWTLPPLPDPASLDLAFHPGLFPPPFTDPPSLDLAFHPGPFHPGPSLPRPSRTCLPLTVWRVPVQPGDRYGSGRSRQGWVTDLTASHNLPLHASLITIIQPSNSATAQLSSVTSSEH